MPFKLIQEDITKLEIEAIVNAANTDLQMGGGVCGAIFNAAGAKELQTSCNKLAPIKTGEAVITPGFALPAKYIIHTAGPIYQNHTPEVSEALLRACYHNALHLALNHKIESIAFPSISSGIYGYPKDKALTVAITTIQSFLEAHEMDIYLTLFGEPRLSRQPRLSENVSSYISRHYNPNEFNAAENLPEKQPIISSTPFLVPHISYESASYQHAKNAKDLESRLKELEDPFSTQLFHLIDSKGKTDVEVYKRANMDRKLFSKIRSTKHYLPGKKTIIALAIALELNLDETQDLLNRAGYSLSNSQFFDVIIEYFIVNRIFDIYDINEVLFSYDLPLLGA